MHIMQQRNIKISQLVLFDMLVIFNNLDSQMALFYMPFGTIGVFFFLSLFISLIYLNFAAFNFFF